MTPTTATYPSIIEWDREERRNVARAELVAAVRSQYTEQELADGLDR